MEAPIDLAITDARIVNATGTIDGGVAVDDGRIVHVGSDGG